MSRARRPHSLNLRTPIPSHYDRTPQYPPVHRSSSRPRYCRQCTNTFHQVMPSPMVPTSVMANPTFYPVTCMIPMMYAPAATPITPPFPVQQVSYEEVLPLPEPPYPFYESDESDTVELEDMRTTAEEAFSTMQRSTLRRSGTIPTNMIRDFEETKWISIDDITGDVQDLTIKRNRWFQRSVELPPGVITKLHCMKLPPEASGDSTLRRYGVEKLQITGRVRQWSPDARAIVEEKFSEVLILPQGTDFSTISYKLQTKNIQQYSGSRFNTALRHHSTSYDNETEEQPFMENTVIVTGRVDRVPQQEAALPTRTWSKEYKQTVKGTVDLLPEGRVVNPVLSSYSEMPDSLVKIVSTPDQDTSYSLREGGCQVRIRLGKSVDRNSIQLEIDPDKETLNVTFAKHSQEDEVTVANEDDQPTTTTNYDMQVKQTFNLAANKFNIQSISKTIQGEDLLLFIPFAKSYQSANLKM